MAAALPPRDEYPSWSRQLHALDAAIYAAVAATPTPTFDKALGALSRAADHSKLWLAAAGLLAAVQEDAAATGARVDRDAAALEGAHRVAALGAGQAVHAPTV